MKKFAQYRSPKLVISCACAVLLGGCGGSNSEGGLDSNATVSIANGGTSAISTKTDITQATVSGSQESASVEMDLASAQVTPAAIASEQTSKAPTPTSTLTPVIESLPASSTCAIPNFEQEVVRLINEARADSRYCGTTLYQSTKPVTWNKKLFAAAASHSTDMATNNYFSHTSQNGRIASQRVTDVGYVWKTTGENIAAGQRTIMDVMKGWIDSPGHCANIMDPNYTEVGVACAQNSASTYKQYWTMSLAAPR